MQARGLRSRSPEKEGVEGPVFVLEAVAEEVAEQRPDRRVRLTRPSSVGGLPLHGAAVEVGLASGHYQERGAGCWAEAVDSAARRKCEYIARFVGVVVVRVCFPEVLARERGEIGAVGAG